MTMQTLTREDPTCATLPGAVPAGRGRSGAPLPADCPARAAFAPVRVADASPAAAAAPRTEAGRRAAQRRRARVAADRRPPSGVLPSSTRTAAVVTADHGDEVDRREFRVGRWTRLVSTLSVLAAGAILGVVLLSSGGSEVIGQVTVTPGDTLWSIAQQADPGADTRAVVDRIKDLNGLGSDAIAAGAVLQVPTAGH